jgi:surface protein
MLLGWMACSCCTSFAVLDYNPFKKSRNPFLTCSFALVPSHVLHYDRASSFNGDGVSNWNVAKVNDISFMFNGAESFNQDLSMWDTSEVFDMSSVFFEATSFNGDISMWNTSKVVDMGSMFEGATSFNQYLSTWVSSFTIAMRQHETNNVVCLFLHWIVSLLIQQYRLHITTNHVPCLSCFVTAHVLFRM